MIDKIVGAILGFAICKALGFLESHGGFTGLLTPTVTYTPHPSGGGTTIPATPPGGLQVTSTAAAFPTQVPAGLPPFPSGWRPAKTTQDVIARAQVYLKTLPANGNAIERASDGRWIRYQKSKQGTKTIVSAWEPKEPVQTSAPTSPAAIPGSPAVIPASYTPAPVAQPGAMPPTLHRGMKGQPIRDLQKLLGIPQDGDFGPGTEKAVKAFQSSHGLKPDGIAGPAFWRAARQTVTSGLYAN